MTLKTRAVFGATALAAISAPASAHIGNHGTSALASAAHFMSSPAHFVPVIAVAAVILFAVLRRAKS